MLTRRSGEEQIRSRLKELSVTELKRVAKEINSTLADGEVDLKISDNPSSLIRQIMTIRNGDVVDALDALELNIDDDEDELGDEDLEDDFDLDSGSEDMDDEDIDGDYEIRFLDLKEEFQFKNEEFEKRLDDFQEKCIEEMKSAFLERRRHRQYLYVATGGGKTLITVDFIHHHFLLKSKRVLWITHQPYLIYQATRTLIQRHGNHYDLAEDLGYFGSEGDFRRHPYRKVIESYKDREWNSGNKPRLLVSTWQALGNINNLDSQTQSGRLLRQFDPSLIVVDEAHWGKGGALEKRIYERLFNKTWSNVPILGLSATPKVRQAPYSNWYKKHIGNIHFASLVGSRLAKPREIPINLGNIVSLRFDKYNRVESSSYDDIAKNDRLNSKIIETYKNEKYRLGKTLVVAANIEHAKALKRKFKEANESVVAIHSKEPDPVRNLREFIQGHYLVGIVVGMAKEGVDIPDLKSVMLAKPITSEVEFAQIIGRASRREFKDHEGKRREKEVFYIVDFFESLENPEYKKLLYHFKDYFRGVNDRELFDDTVESHRIGSPNIYETKKIEVDPLEQHEFDQNPVFKTLRYVDNCDVDLLVLNHMRINTRQTFGIEFELAPKKGGPPTSPEKSWRSIADQLREFMKSVLQEDGSVASPVWDIDRVKDINHKKWNIVNDPSCGWEIVTPILKGEKGFVTIAKFLSELNSSGLLDKLGLEVGPDAGTHVNLGWDFREPWIVQNLLRFMRAFEPALFTLVPPSRVIGPNEYCAPIGTRFTDSEISGLATKSKISKLFEDYDERYHTVNLTKYDDPVQVLEVRFHGGTINAHKILLWTSLWMNLLPAISKNTFEVLRTGDSKKIQLPGPNEKSDILHLLQSVIGLSAPEEKPYLELFDKRRADVFLRNEWWKSELANHGSVSKFLQDRAKAIVG